jgi:hypothetical protein
MRERETREEKGRKGEKEETKTLRERVERHIMGV